MSEADWYRTLNLASLARSALCFSPKPFRDGWRAAGVGNAPDVAR